MSGYYDNTDFFHSYMEMPRSKGLSFAGEWHQLEPLIPDTAGKNVLDLGIKLLDWLAERETYYPVRIHTSNPVGRANMQRLIERYWK